MLGIRNGRQPQLDSTHEAHGGALDGLAVALGLQACAHGVRVLFTPATGLIATLGKAFAEGRLDERLKLLTPRIT